MELHEYPRPINDTGIGIHWTTGYATAIGMRQIREFWIPEMKALGIKWVKIYNHDGALDFAELLLAEGMMPIVRIYRPTPNPSRLDVKDVVQIDAYLRLGVRYFEFNSEPDRDAEWKGGRMPANGLNLVVENTIANMEIILERGGMPAVPAVSSGSRWDLVGKIVAFGRKDLFAGPVWQAIHNYPRNRPLDYPYDIGNQEGAAYTYRFYQVVHEEKWQENAWRGRSLEEINRLRSDRSNPGATIMDDHACWLAYEYFDALNQKHLGHSIPLLSTEGGYLVGEDIDPRYPATSPDLHMAQTLESCRIMMGTSQRFPPAPDYYFCTAFWLLGNAQLGSTSNWWETHAWYSDRWPGGALPLAFALKSEPKVARRWHGYVANELVTLYGTVTNAGDCRTVVLYKVKNAKSDEDGGRQQTLSLATATGAAVQTTREEQATATLDQSSRYRFEKLSPGPYLLTVPGSTVEQQVELAAGQQELLLDLDLKPQRMPAHKSRLIGSVRGGAGVMLVLVQLTTGEEWTTLAHDDGSFRFIDLPGGEYSLRVEPAGSRVDRLRLDGLNEEQIELAVAGWGYTIRPVPPSVQSKARLNSAYCVVQGWPGLPVRIHSDQWSSEPVYTGSAPEIGSFGCELTDLEPGYYIVTVDGVPGDDGRYVQLEAHIAIDKKQTPLLEFIYTEMLTGRMERHSQIHGRVIGGQMHSETTSHSGNAILFDSMGHRQEQAVGPDRTFHFANLPAGLYTVALAGEEAATSVADLALDGRNQLMVELRLPTPPTTAPANNVADEAHSVIAGFAPDAAGSLARLVDMVGNEFQQYVDADHKFRFSGLAAGTYTLAIESGYRQADLVVDGKASLHVQFAELLPIWQAETSHAGSMPGYSLVRVEVEGMVDLPVHLWKEDWEGMVRHTGSKAEYGPYVLEFSPLGPGRYMVEPTGLGLWAEVELTGLEAIWIHFRKRTQPLGENLVEPLRTGVTQPVRAALPEPTTAVQSGISANTSEKVQPAMPSSGATSTKPHRTDELAAAEQKPVVKSTQRYLFVWSPPQDPNELSALLNYVTAEQPQIGRDRWLAFDADHVTIVGANVDTKKASTELTEFVRALESAGVVVDYLYNNSSG